MRTEVHPPYARRRRQDLPEVVVQEAVFPKLVHMLHIKQLQALPILTLELVLVMCIKEQRNTKESSMKMRGISITLLVNAEWLGEEHPEVVIPVQMSPMIDYLPLPGGTERTEDEGIEIVIFSLRDRATTAHRATEVYPP